MKNKYYDLENINTYDIGLFEPTDPFGKMIQKNGITNLSELLYKDDQNLIIYYLSPGTKYTRACLEGIINLIRYKYLKEQCIYNPFLESCYEKERGEFTKDANQIGFNYRELSIIFNNGVITYASGTLISNKTLPIKNLFLNEEIFNYIIYSAKGPLKNKGYDSFLNKMNLIKEYLLEKERQANNLNADERQDSLLLNELKKEKTLLEKLKALELEHDTVKQQLEDTQQKIKQIRQKNNNIPRN